MIPNSGLRNTRTLNFGKCRFTVTAAISPALPAPRTRTELIRIFFAEFNPHPRHPVNLVYVAQALGQGQWLSSRRREEADGNAAQVDIHPKLEAEFHPNSNCAPPRQKAGLETAGEEGEVFTLTSS
jgi:hypothetical protein